MTKPVQLPTSPNICHHGEAARQTNHTMGFSQWGRGRSLPFLFLTSPFPHVLSPHPWPPLDCLMLSRCGVNPSPNIQCYRPASQHPSKYITQDRLGQSVKCLSLPARMVSPGYSCWTSGVQWVGSGPSPSHCIRAILQKTLITTMTSTPSHFITKAMQFLKLSFFPL